MGMVFKLIWTSTRLKPGRYGVRFPGGPRYWYGFRLEVAARDNREMDPGNCRGAVSAGETGDAPADIWPVPP